MERPWRLLLVALLAAIDPARSAVGSASAATPQARPVVATASAFSGYVVTGADGAYSSVSATWTVSAVTCTATASSSFWVGLDGFNSASVEQIGIEADCSGKTAEYFGWYEMYPAPPVDFANSVKPGDAMAASVTFSGTDTYKLVLADSTQGWSRTITKNETGLARSSAEVITEGPPAAGLLADFGTVSYAKCEVNGTSLGLQNPTRLVVTDANGHALDSTSPITSAGAFSNTWLRSS